MTTTYYPQDPIVQNLVASGIWWIFGLVIWLARRRVQLFFSRNLLSPTWVWVCCSVVCVLPLIVDFIFFAPPHMIGTVTSFALLVISGIWIIKPFALAGIYAAYQKTTDGIDFEVSLGLVHSKLDFLGIGADKLTRSDEFERALLRVSRAGSPVRMLLSAPDNPILKAAANRAGLNPTVYQRRVRGSLERIAKLRIDKGFNIEVRFYVAASEKDYQQFRLMFIDERICLVSHTVWDKSDGTDNPQIVLVATEAERTRQLIAAFSDHFERVWNDPTTQSVDLAKYK